MRLGDRIECVLPPAYDRAPSVLLPFDGRARVQMSPARRIPSHGTHLFATTYAIDFVPVDARGQSGACFTWRTLLWRENPGLFAGFGAAVLAPAAGTVAYVHDGEPDHAAMRSQPALVSYALTQRKRIAQGANAIAGNRVVIRMCGAQGWLLLAHCKRGSITVAQGERVVPGQQVAQVGNSGNSTEPHLHMQLMDGPDGTSARGLPLVFEGYRELARGASSWRNVARGVPGEGSLVERDADAAHVAEEAERADGTNGVDGAAGR